MLIRLTLILKICLLWPQAPIRRTAAPLLRVISPTRSSRWRGTDPSPASIARGSSYLRAWTRYHCTEPHRTSVFIRRYCAETAEISHTIWLRCGFLETVFSFMNRLGLCLCLQMLDPLSMSSPENSASGSCPSLDSPLDRSAPQCFIQSPDTSGIISC